MEVAKLSALPNLEVRYVSCNESAKKRCLRSEQEETVFSLTHELFMTQHFTNSLGKHQGNYKNGHQIFSMEHSIENSADTLRIPNSVVQNIFQSF